MEPGPRQPASPVPVVILLGLVVVFAATTGIMANSPVYWCSAGPVVLLGSVALIAYLARRLEVVRDLVDLIRSARGHR
jgi:hypothetical protein